MTRRIVIVVNGYPRAGKDTACRFIIEAMTQRGWLTHLLSSIDPVRTMLRELGVPVDLKTPAERDLLAEVKSALDRYDWWATRLCARQTNERLADSLFRNAACFVQMREVAAIKKYLTLFGPEIERRTLLVTNPRAERVTSNVADVDVENMTYELTLPNDGTLADLRERCIALADMLTEEKSSDHHFRQDDPALA